MEVERVLDLILFCQQQLNYWHAQQLRALAEFAELRADDEFAEEEIAPLLRWTKRHADDELHLARELVSRLPGTVDAVEKGEIDRYKASIIHDHTMSLPVDKAREVERRVLDAAADLTSTQLRRLLRRVVLLVDPEGARERAAEKKAAREAGMRPQEDDMALLWTLLPADRAVACAHRVDKLARAAKTPGDPRTLNQRRADVVADLLLATPDQAPSVKVHLYVTVSATTLLGLDEHPGELAGFGPITADMARELAGDATWSRLLTDPVSGQLLDFGTTTYRPPAALRKFLWARDKSCTHPGCAIAAQRCEIDHTIPFPQGPTAPANCGPRCKRHHRLKHTSAWLVTQPTPGRFVHHSPAGRTYVREPEPVLIGS